MSDIVSRLPFWRSPDGNGRSIAGPMTKSNSFQLLRFFNLLSFSDLTTGMKRLRMNGRVPHRSGHSPLPQAKCRNIFVGKRIKAQTAHVVCYPHSHNLLLSSSRMSNRNSDKPENSPRRLSKYRVIAGKGSYSHRRIRDSSGDEAETESIPATCL